MQDTTLRPAKFFNRCFLASSNDKKLCECHAGHSTNTSKGSFIGVFWCHPAMTKLQGCHAVHSTDTDQVL